MNLSDNTKNKLENIKADFYKSLVVAFRDEINEDGVISVSLKNVTYEYESVFEKGDFLLLRKKGTDLVIADNFDEKDFNDYVKNEKNYSIVKCQKGIVKEIKASIESYNRNTERVEKLKLYDIVK